LRSVRLKCLCLTHDPPLVCSLKRCRIMRFNRRFYSAASKEWYGYVRRGIISWDCFLFVMPFSCPSTFEYGNVFTCRRAFFSCAVGPYDAPALGRRGGVKGRLPPFGYGVRGAILSSLFPVVTCTHGSPHLRLCGVKAGVCRCKRYLAFCIAA
jgi:hypothetical protein